MPSNAKPTVQELELELRNVRIAFEEYLHTSRHLEESLDKDVIELHTQLSEARQANEAMASKLESMEPVLLTQEQEINAQKQQLREEQRKRLEAKSALEKLESECRHEYEETIQQMEKDNRELRDECNALHEELTFKCKELDRTTDDHKQYVRRMQEEERSRKEAASKINNINSTSTSSHNDISHNNSTPSSVKTDMACEITKRASSSVQVDESYTELVSELESTTEQLEKTLQQLWTTEDKLRESESKQTLLMDDLDHLKTQLATKETEFAQAESQQRDDSIQRQATTEATESELRDECHALKQELSHVTRELRDAEQDMEMYRERMDEMQRGHAADVEALEHKHKHVEADNAEQKRLYQNLQVTKDKYKQQNEELVNECTMLKQEVTEVTEALHVAKEDAKVYRQRFDEAREKSNGDDWQSRIDRLQDEIELKRKDIYDLERTIRQEKETKHHSEDQIQDLRAKNQAQKSAMEDLERMVSEMRDVSKAASEDLFECRQVLEASQDENDALHNDIQQLHQQLHDLQPDRQEAMLRDKIALDIRETVTREVEQTTIKALKEEQEREITTLREKFKRLFHDHEVLQEKLQHHSSMKEEIPRLKDEVMRLEASLQAQHNDNEIALREVETLWKNRCDVLKQDSAKEMKERCAVKFSAEKHEMMTEISNLLQEAESIKIKLEESQAAYADILSEYTLAKEEVLDLTTRCDDANAKLKLSEETADSLRAEMKATKETAESLRKEVDETKDIVATLEAEIADLEDEREGDRGVELISKLLGSSSSCSMEPQTNLADPPSSHSMRQARTINLDPDETESTHEAQGKSELLQSRLDEVMKENAELKSGVHLASESENNIPSKTISVLESFLDASRDENVALRSTIAEMQSKLTSYQHNESTLTRDELTALHEEKTNLEMRLLEAQEELCTLKDNLASAETIAAYYRERDNAASNDNGSSRAVTFAPKHGDPLAATADSSHNKSKRQQSDPSPERRADDAGESDQSLHILRQQLKSLTEDKQKLQNQMDDARIALSVSEYSHEKCQSDLNTSQQQVEELRQTTEGLQKQLSHLETKYARSLAEGAASTTLNSTIDGAQTAAAAAARADNERRPTVSKDEFDELSAQLKRTQDLFREVQEKLHETQRKLRSVDNDSRKQAEQVLSLEETVGMCREEMNAVKEERSRLTSDLETSRADYESLLHELEGMERMFSEAQHKAAQTGREAAEKELRTQMKKREDRERSSLKSQLKDALGVNESLRQQLQMASAAASHIADAHANANTHGNATSRAKSPSKSQGHGRDDRSSKQIRMLKQETMLLKDSLEASLTESKELRERVFTLNNDLSSCKMDLSRRTEELKSCQSKLDLAKSQSPSMSDSALNRTGAFDGTNSMNAVKLNLLKDHLQRLIVAEGRGRRNTGGYSDDDDDDSDASNTSSYTDDGDSIERVEALKLKVELVDMNISLEKVAFENELLKEEITTLKSSLDDAKSEVDKQSAMAASTRAQLAKERQREMNEFKNQFTVLIEENSNIKKKYKESKHVTSKTQTELTSTQERCEQLTASLIDSQRSIQELETEIEGLNAEMQRALEESEQRSRQKLQELKSKQARKLENARNDMATMKEQIDMLKIELDAKSQELHESTVMEDMHKNKIKSLEASLHTSQQAATALENEVSTLSEEIEKINLARMDDDEAFSTKHRSMIRKLEDREQEMESLRADIKAQQHLTARTKETLQRAQEETVATKKQVDSITEDFERSCVEITELSTELDEAKAEIERKVKDGEDQLAEIKTLRSRLKTTKEEKADIEQQLDDTNVALSVSKYSHDRNHEELHACQELLKSSRDETILLKTELTKMNVSMASSRKEKSKKLVELEEVNTMINELHDLLFSDDMNKMLSDGGTAQTANVTDDKNDDGGNDENSSTIRSSNSNGEDEQRHLHQDIWQVSSRVSDLIRHLKRYKKLNDTSVSDLRLARDRVKKLGNEVRSMKARVTTQQHQHQHQPTNAQNERMNRLHEDIKMLNTKNAALKERIRSLEASLVSKTTEQAQATMDLKLARAKLQDSEQEAARLKEQVQKIQTELTDAAAQADKACAAAKEEGKAEAASELRSEMKSAKSAERKELVTQFKSLHKENSTLRRKLSEVKLQSSTNVQSTIKEREDLIEQVKDAQRHAEEAETQRDIAKVKLEALKKTMDELSRLQTANAGALEKGPTTSLVPANANDHRRKALQSADISLLQKEFRKLTKVSNDISQKVRTAEEAIIAVQGEQKKTKHHQKERSKIAKKLITEMEEANEERAKHDTDIDDLAATLITRVARAEQSVNKLDNEISLAKGALQISESGLLLRDSQQKPPAKHKQKQSKQRTSPKHAPSTPRTRSEAPFIVEQASDRLDLARRLQEDEIRSDEIRSDEAAGGSSDFDTSESRDDTRTMKRRRSRTFPASPYVSSIPQPGRSALNSSGAWAETARSSHHRQPPKMVPVMIPRIKRTANVNTPITTNRSDRRTTPTPLGTAGSDWHQHRNYSGINLAYTNTNTTIGSADFNTSAITNGDLDNNNSSSNNNSSGSSNKTVTMPSFGGAYSSYNRRRAPMLSSRHHAFTMDTFDASENDYVADESDFSTSHATSKRSEVSSGRE